MKPNELIQLSRLKEKDINDLIALSSKVGWNYDKQEIMTLLASGKAYGYLTEEKKVIACAAIIPYGSILASIGMVIVHPEYRGLGLARELVKTCMNQVSEDTTFMLIATEEGRPVYEKLGFKKYSHVTRLFCPALKTDSALSISEIKTMNKEDIQKVIEIDKQAFGDSRHVFLENRIGQAIKALVIKNEYGTVDGYALLIQQSSNLVIGPVVAKNDQHALQLIQAIASNEKVGLRMDVLEGQDGIVSQLQKLGFQLVNQPPIMIKTEKPFPTRNHSLYAIAAQAYG